MARSGKQGNEEWRRLLARCMSDGVNGLTTGEPSLLKLYMELTGASESAARSVFMHVCCCEMEEDSPPEGRGVENLLREEAARFSHTEVLEPASRWISRVETVPVGG